MYASLFKKPEPYITIVSLLATKRRCLTRNELIENGKFVDNGGFSQMLENLESCGFIRNYNAIGKEKKDSLYQLVDPFTIFYYEFIKGNKNNDPNFWTHCLNTNPYHTWCGLSFERVCLLHVEQIKHALGISGVISRIHSWRSSATKNGAQIDLLIDRDDDVIDLCEMKYTKAPWEMTDEDSNDIIHKESVFRSETGTTKAIHNVLVSANGVKRNAYSDDLQNIVTLDDLFI